MIPTELLVQEVDTLTGHLPIQYTIAWHGMALNLYLNNHSFPREVQCVPECGMLKIFHTGMKYELC